MTHPLTTALTEKPVPDSKAEDRDRIEELRIWAFRKIEDTESRFMDTDDSIEWSSIDAHAYHLATKAVLTHLTDREQIKSLEIVHLETKSTIMSTIGKDDRKLMSEALFDQKKLSVLVELGAKVTELLNR